MDAYLISVPLEVGATSAPAKAGPARPPCLDYDPTDHRIYPCGRCDSWWAEVTRDPAGHLVVREWHDSTCPELLDWQ